MAGKVQLSDRLTAIAEMVTEGNRLVDVGCDHGYLPVYLMLQHKIPGAIATDVGKGPLTRAQEHIAQYHMEAYIETRLCNGLSEIRPGEGDTLVIAGMGGPLMERILSAGRHALPGFQELILQPQSDIPHFRRFVMQNGYQIVQEEMILEDGKFYPIMKVVQYEGEQPAVWSREEEMFGRLLLERKHPVLKLYLERELRIRSEISAQLESASGDVAMKRRMEVEEEKQLILTALKRYES